MAGLYFGKTNVLKFDFKEPREGFRHQHDISCAGLYMMDMSDGGFTRSQKFATFRKLHVFATF